MEHWIFDQKINEVSGRIPLSYKYFKRYGRHGVLLLKAQTLGKEKCVHTALHTLLIHNVPNIHKFLFHRNKNITFTASLNSIVCKIRVYKRLWINVDCPISFV